MKKRGKILIIDYNEKVYMQNREFLEKTGYITDLATSGKDGIKDTTIRNYDAVIVNIKMPDICGLDIIRNIRSLKPELPLIMIADRASPRSAVIAMKLGAEDFIQVPCRPQELLESIEKAHTGKNITETDIGNGPADGRIIIREDIEKILKKISIKSILKGTPPFSIKKIFNPRKPDNNAGNVLIIHTPGRNKIINSSKKKSDIHTWGKTCPGFSGPEDT